VNNRGCRVAPLKIEDIPEASVTCIAVHPYNNNSDQILNIELQVGRMQLDTLDARLEQQKKEEEDPRAGNREEERFRE
jgi:hypothetical protein